MRAEVVKLYIGGASYKEIAASLGIGRRQVEHQVLWARRKGELSPEQRQRQPEKRRRIVALALTGASPAEISAAIGSTVPSVLAQIRTAMHRGELPGLPPDKVDPNYGLHKSQPRAGRGGSAAWKNFPRGERCEVCQLRGGHECLQGIDWYATQGRRETA